MTSRRFTDSEMQWFRALADDIKTGRYEMPEEGVHVKPAGDERHTSPEHTTLSSPDWEASA